MFFLLTDLGGVFSINGPRSFYVVLIMGVFCLSMDLGRSYHGSVFSINGPRSFLSWECFFLSMDLGRSYRGGVFFVNGPRSFLS